MAATKKNGKANAKAKAAEAKKPEVQAAAVETEEKKQSKRNSVFIDRVSEKFIHERQGKDGKTYCAVSFDMNDGKGTYGSFLVKPGQIIQTTKKTKDGAEVPVEGYKNVLVGSPNQQIQVSVNDEKLKFPTVKMTATEIKQAFDGAKAAYKEAKKEKAAEKAAQAGAEAEGPDVV